MSIVGLSIANYNKKDSLNSKKLLLEAIASYPILNNKKDRIQEIEKLGIYPISANLKSTMQKMFVEFN